MVHGQSFDACPFMKPLWKVGRLHSGDGATFQTHQESTAAAIGKRAYCADNAVLVIPVHVITSLHAHDPLPVAISSPQARIQPTENRLWHA
jgi:hypothetical protein